MLALGVLLANVGDGKTCSAFVRIYGSNEWNIGEARTRGQTLLELLGLIGILEDEGVDVL